MSLRLFLTDSLHNRIYGEQNIERGLSRAQQEVSRAVTRLANSHHVPIILPPQPGTFIAARGGALQAGNESQTNEGAHKAGSLSMNVYGGSVVTSTAAASHLFHALTCYDTTKNTFPYLFEVYNETVLQHVSDCLWAYLILPLLHEIFIVNNRKKAF